MVDVHAVLFVELIVPAERRPGREEEEVADSDGRRVARRGAVRRVVLRRRGVATGSFWCSDGSLAATQSQHYPLCEKATLTFCLGMRACGGFAW